MWFAPENEKDPFKPWEYETDGESKKLPEINVEAIRELKQSTDMFENLQERLERSFKILKGEGKITEINIAETLKDIRRALLDADLHACRQKALQQPSAVLRIFGKRCTKSSALT